MMEQIAQFMKTHEALIGVLMMPFTYGFVGWFTNWVALKMTFYPLKFWGIPPYIGWQGIIPRKSVKMAEKAVDVITARLLKIEEIFDKVDPKQVEKELKPLLNQVTREITQDIVDQINPQLWKLLPDPVKEEIVKNAQTQTPKTIRTIISDIRANIYHVFDLKGMVVKAMTGKNVKLSVDMFQKVGKPEFRFIEISGLYFGLLLGAIQMGIWYLFPIWWTLPIQGIIVGYVTNWLALNMIFRPLRPTKYGPFTYHGLFMKRQAEVSKEYANLVATNIFTPRKILEQVLYGRATEEIFSLIRQSVAKAVDHTSSVAKPVMSFTMGEEKYEELKALAVEKMTSIVPTSAKKLEQYIGKVMDIENTMHERMKALEPEEFEKILRTAFQEDEFILILVGAVLGAIVGLGQALYMIM